MTIMDHGDIERRIYAFRGKRVMLDSDLADIYGVSTKRLNEQVRRNRERFPERDFVFRLTTKEAGTIRSQFATASKRNIRYLPYVFTKDGSVMLATVLKTRRAALVSLQVVRAFNRTREILETHIDIAGKIRKLEKTVGRKFRKHEKAIQIIFDALHQLMNPPRTPVVGFMAGQAGEESAETRRRTRRR
ncbi:ORF6N domain-containing protein [bacterium]|nr:ORF6N domain-containing protein [bacterium]